MLSDDGKLLGEWMDGQMDGWVDAGKSQRYKGKKSGESWWWSEHGSLASLRSVSE